MLWNKAWNLIFGQKNGENEKKGTTGDPKSGDEKQEGSKEDIILKVYMHCEGCANKVLKSLRGFDGMTLQKKYNNHITCFS